MNQAKQVAITNGLEGCSIFLSEQAQERSAYELATLIPDGAAGESFAIPLPLLGGSACETWLVNEPAADVSAGDIRASSAVGMVLCELRKPLSDDLAADSLEVYERLVSFIAEKGYPHIVKAWNYVPDINRGDGDRERYRQFCVGRANALEALYSKGGWPAGTGVGCGSGTALQVTLLASARAPLAIENPRQTSAYHYPRSYGPKSPSFSRASVIGEVLNQLLFISGTASIVGHSSMHTGDLVAQVDETMQNWQALFQRHQDLTGVLPLLNSRSTFRVYLRNAQHMAACQAALQDYGLPLERTLFLQADICRRELLFEIDGIIALRSAA